MCASWAPGSMVTQREIANRHSQKAVSTSCAGTKMTQSCAGESGGKARRDRWRRSERSAALAPRIAERAADTDRPSAVDRLLQTAIEERIWGRGDCFVAKHATGGDDHSGIDLEGMGATDGQRRPSDNYGIQYHTSAEAAVVLKQVSERRTLQFFANRVHLLPRFVDISVEVASMICEDAVG